MNKKHIIGYAATTVVALTIGAAASGGEAAEPVAAPGPTPTVTQTVTAEPEVVTETTVPQVCLDALDAADALALASSEALGLAGQALGEVPAMIDALMVGDAAELDRINVAIGEHNSALQAIDTERLTADYATKRDACRAEQ